MVHGLGVLERDDDRRRAGIQAELSRVIRFANAAGAIVAGRLACSDAMPTEAEVDGLLAGQSGVQRVSLIRSAMRGRRC